MVVVGHHFPTLTCRVWENHRSSAAGIRLTSAVQGQPATTNALITADDKEKLPQTTLLSNRCVLRGELGLKPTSTCF